MDMHFHLFSNLIGKSYSILKENLIDVLRGIFIAQRSRKTMRSKMTFIVQFVSNETA